MIVMEMKLKKEIKNLQKEVMLKSIELDDDVEDFKLKSDDYETNEKFITISPRCIRCDLCFQECPVDSIIPSSSAKKSKIKDNCVKCEICAQTCPVSCIYVMETKSIINEEDENVEYFLKEKKVPHRLLRMENIDIDRNNCGSCGTCTKFCPTNAISLIDKSAIEAADGKIYSNLEDGKYPFIKKSLCMGCGSCFNLCLQGAINLERTLGPIIEIQFLNINHDACVECNLCEENCPVGAIKLENGKVVIDNKSCIRCNICSKECPVNALSLEEIDN